MPMKAIFLVLSFFAFLAFSQEVELRHYQRTHGFETLPLPNHRFEASKFNIMFADSLYDVAKVQIKKAEFLTHNTKVSLFLEARKGLYYQVMFIFKGQKKLNKVLQMIHQAFPNANIPNDVGTHCLTSGSDQIHLEIRRQKSRFIVVLKHGPCN